MRRCFAKDAAGAAARQDSKRVPHYCSATRLQTIGAYWSPHLRLICLHSLAFWAMRLIFCHGSATSHLRSVSFAASFATAFVNAIAVGRKDCRSSDSISSNARHSFHTNAITCQMHATHS